MLNIDHTYRVRKGNSRCLFVHFKAGRQLDLEVAPNKRFRISLGWETHTDDGDDGLTIMVCLPFLFSFYATLTNVFRDDAPGREYGVRYYDDLFTLNWGFVEEGWPSHRKDKIKGYHRSFFVRDVLFGRDKHASKTLKVERVLVSLPEGNYPTTLTFTEDTWTRPRGFKPRKVFRVHAEPDTPFPVEGKGENSWDIGEDAIYSMTFLGRTAPEAIAYIVQDVLRERDKNGIPESVEHVGGYLLKSESAASREDL